MTADGGRPLLGTLAAALCAAILAAPAAAAAAASLVLDLGPEGEIIRASYRCGAETLAVRYVDAGANALALIPLDDEERVFVNVIAASGARYVSGTYEWWTKGDTATLRNRMDEANVVTCAVVRD